MFLLSSIPVPAVWLMLNWTHEGAAILALRGSVKAAFVINAGAFLTYVGYFMAILAVTSLTLRLAAPQVHRNFASHAGIIVSVGLLACALPWLLTGVPLQLSSAGWIICQAFLWVLATKTITPRAASVRVASQVATRPRSATQPARLPTAS